jgi:hypothetical protein
MQHSADTACRVLGVLLQATGWATVTAWRDTGRLTRAGTGDEYLPGERCRRHERAVAAAWACHSVVAEMRAMGGMVGPAWSLGAPPISRGLLGGQTFRLHDTRRAWEACQSSVR